ncbi:MAG: phospholipase D-like domain-containing protein [Verrucomicrobiota bacterium]|jgi:hypothetical protein|nr:phospholipase D-like domain-containing protein [Verrucomicrobiota bacterium]
MSGLGCTLALLGMAKADSYTGTAWSVRFNRPDQTTGYSSIGPEEFAIREAWVARLQSLQSGDWACLSTYTFSGASAATGAAGPILEAMSNALARGVSLAFVADHGVDIQSNYWPGVSLASLSQRPGNVLQLSRSPQGGIMHDKMGVFWHAGSRQGWVLSGSWNFTTGASSQQWNILTELQDNTLSAAYSNEFRELLSGRFHGNPHKSHAHDGTRFRMEGFWQDGWVRFAPYPDALSGGNNALTDITNAIAGATNEIFFALNKLTRRDVVDELIRACDRGVAVHGVISKSDWLNPGADSHEMVKRMLERTNYATWNRIRLFPAYYDAAHTRYDNNNRDLVHTKYMILDPRSPRPMLIHGSANWTASALVSTNANDENVQFLPHAGMALAFLEHFAQMTDGMKPWCALRVEDSGFRLWLDYWLPDVRLYAIGSTTRLEEEGSWSSQTINLPKARGTHTVELPVDGRKRFYRLQAQ